MERYVVDPGWRILLTDLGLQPGDLLRRAGLPEDLLARSDAGLAAADYYRLWEVLAAEVGPGMLPARMLEALSAEMFSPPLFAALCSPDLAVAAARIRDFKPLIGPMRLDVQRTPDALSIGIGFGPGPSVPPGALVAFELGFFVQLARIATRHRVVPRAATSTSDATALGSFTDFLGVPLQPGERNRVVFDITDARRPFVTENEPMWRHFEPGLRQRLADLAGGAGTTERVRAALLDLIPAGLTDAEDVARRLAMSKRTLQRRLQQEGTSYKAVLGAVREALARHYIAQRDLPYAQISFLLGYEDPNSFFRAFSAWTGMTPETARTRAVH